MGLLLFFELRKGNSIRSTLPVHPKP